LCTARANARSRVVRSSREKLGNDFASNVSTTEGLMLWDSLQSSKDSAKRPIDRVILEQEARWPIMFFAVVEVVDPQYLHAARAVLNDPWG